MTFRWIKIRGIRIHRIGILGIQCLLSLLSSCGYRTSEGPSLLKHHATLSVPYIKGDLDGRFTSAVIKALGSSSTWRYAQVGGDLILEIEILRSETRDIGYQYDRVKSTAELIDRLIPNERRSTLSVGLKIVDAAQKSVLWGPCEIEASGDYDFVNFDTYKDLAFVNEQGVAQSVLTFSLGQLDAEEGARDAVLDVVYQSLAEKIVLGLDQL